MAQAFSRLRLATASTLWGAVLGGVPGQLQCLEPPTICRGRRAGGGAGRSAQKSSGGAARRPSLPSSRAARGSARPAPLRRSQPLWARPAPAKHPTFPHTPSPAPPRRQAPIPAPALTPPHSPPSSSPTPTHTQGTCPATPQPPHSPPPKKNKRTCLRADVVQPVLVVLHEAAQARKVGAVGGLVRLQPGGVLLEGVEVVGDDAVHLRVGGGWGKGCGWVWMGGGGGWGGGG